MLKKDLFLKEKRTADYDVKEWQELMDKNADMFMQKCLWNKYNPECYKKAEQYLAESENSDEFIDKFLADKSLKMCQAYGEISRRCRPDTHWYRIREMFGERCFKTNSDVGSVKIGNEKSYTLIPNGIGDGTTRVAVFSKEEAEKEFNSHMFDKGFTCTVCGEDIYVHDYDCGASIATRNGVEVKLNGCYFVYTYVGLVALVQFRKDIAE